MAKFSREFFGLAFPGCQAPPPKKFTPRIVGIPLQFYFREPKFYSRRSSAYWGDQNSPCCKRSPAKGVWQKSDEKSDRSVRKSDRKVTESVPKTKKSDRTPFAALLLRHPEKSSIKQYARKVEDRSGTMGLSTGTVEVRVLPPAPRLLQILARDA